MTRIFSRTVPIDVDIVDAFCVLQKGFTDQFVYYDKRGGNDSAGNDSAGNDRGGNDPAGKLPVKEHEFGRDGKNFATRITRYMGLGRCIALTSLEDVDYEFSAATSTASAVNEADTTDKSSYIYDEQPAVFFSFNRFDAENPAPTDDLLGSFPRLHFMLPEVVLIENAYGSFLQVNSLGPIYAGRVDRFVRMCKNAPHRQRVSIPYSLKPDSREAWCAATEEALGEISGGRVRKVVLSRRKKLVAQHPFSSKDLLVNLIDGSAQGTVIMYRYADVFFCGCTPELLVRKRGNEIESMCLAGTCPAGANAKERADLAANLLNDPKNRAEHDYVVRFIRSVLDRVCYDVEIPETPTVMSLAHIQHLFTPVYARALEGIDLATLVQDLHPTPATSGVPVGEAKMLIRRIEPYGRGLYAGAAGIVDAAGNGEFSVALRSGVFDGEIGWVYAGCGIVEGSDADAEYDEIDLKLQTILTAFNAEADLQVGADAWVDADEEIMPNRENRML